jgi:hypothetical protein
MMGKLLIVWIKEKMHLYYIELILIVEIKMEINN